MAGKGSSDMVKKGVVSFHKAWLELQFTEIRIVQKIQCTGLVQQGNSKISCRKDEK